MMPGGGKRAGRRRVRTRAVLAGTLVGVVVLGLGVVGWRVHLRTWSSGASAEGGGPDASESPEARFRHRLRREGELSLSPEAVASTGREVRLAVEERMDRVAREIRPDASDWRPLFEALAREHPGTEGKVLALYREELARAEGFVRERALVPVPENRPRVFPVENPALRRVFPLALYVNPDRLGVILRSGRARTPDPEYLRNHCFVCVPPLAVHEGYPGHHVAYSMIRGLEDPELVRRAEENRRNMFFHEGWAQYGEILLFEEGYWREDPSRELGALRMVLLRALRAEIDGRLVVGSISEAEAVAAYVEIPGLTEEAARTEIRGHLDEPGRKSSYLLGALQILALREAPEAGGAEPSRRTFHRRVLRSPGPLPRIARETFGLEPETLRLSPELLSLETVEEGGRTETAGASEVAGPR
ncbi:MAG: DUF885 family protein [Thermoanaerobaculia bacterium]|nr:DUF885 family protein [Thermoanaerobaculia bacterium]